MVMISSLQHGWTLFVHPINDKYEWGRAAIQVAFTVFILSETWLVPFEGWFVDRLGPKPVALAGGLLVRRRLEPEFRRQFPAAALSRRRAWAASARAASMAHASAMR